MRISYCTYSALMGWIITVPIRVVGTHIGRVDKVEFIEGSPQRYTSSEGNVRGFCPECGTPLWWEGIWADKSIQMVTIASLDDPEIYPPDRHASCHNQISWFDVADDLPRYEHSSPED